MKTVRVILSPEAEEVYKYLNEHAEHSKRERTFFNVVNKKIDLIKANVHYGDSIAKKRIPSEYRIKYGVDNLFRVELPNYWRMLYTLTEGENQIEIVAFVLDIFDHKEYNKKFGYKNK
ncbi:hypothetical protein KKF81_05120 [Candidatus Micrarchaeota archaeon]|nr:hypothetical protein [Candidatus Micrarchaeota archaeon]MBU1166308.1 hypothetical protein [Candidatus Micrarchaeota archaeon]MBU1886382.1 hypothetical protein [Candidatus Micrarchaeota archaeon]